jgi:hypothetical protein
MLEQVKRFVLGLTSSNVPTPESNATTRGRLCASAPAAEGGGYAHKAAPQTG